MWKENAHRLGRTIFSLNRLTNVVVKVLLTCGIRFSTSFRWYCTHFRILVRKCLVHMRTVYAPPQKLARPLRAAALIRINAVIIEECSELQSNPPGLEVFVVQSRPQFYSLCHAFAASTESVEDVLEFSQFRLEPRQDTRLTKWKTNAMQICCWIMHCVSAY